MKTGSPIAIGARGKYRGVPFVVRGHLELCHESGSTWDEWYARFADGRDGWIARAERRWLVTFGEGSWLPSWAEIGVGDRAWPAFVVAEKGRATFAAKEGMLPFVPRLGRAYRYADLRGPRGAFATIDYGDEPPTLFVGRLASLKELGLQNGRRPRPRSHATASARRRKPNRSGGK